jgi:hypothetical protein
LLVSFSDIHGAGGEGKGIMRRYSDKGGKWSDRIKSIEVDEEFSLMEGWQDLQTTVDLNFGNEMVHHYSFPYFTVLVGNEVEL